ncbi:MAG: pantetheine-phosphate adenylyltransferase [Nitrospirae bacterium CG01_land_8_20_14_3_00_44_22]|nr:MAG: pantetheine-phosphate adenylyltransferase [Nitrospirae bacterium CG01_land_8_20_14_3_00_44_22]
MKRIAIYPGTFDPITNGHIDLVQRGLRIFDKVIIAITTAQKKQPLFTADERIDLIKNALKGFKNVSVDSFNGLLIEYAKSKNGTTVIRGLRAVSDFEYEFQMALMNRRLAVAIETVFMMPSEEYSFLTSTIVKEVASFGGSVKGLVPEAVEKALRRKFQK